MKSLTVKMPAFLASALINGDTSGLECTCAEIAARNEGKPGKRLGTTHRKGCDFYWLRAAIAYCEPGEVVSTADGECDCGAEEGEECADDCASFESGDSYFSWSCDLPGFGLGADMVDYVVLYPDVPKVTP
jgi:hypothetical protein